MGQNTDKKFLQNRGMK